MSKTQIEASKRINIVLDGEVVRWPVENVLDLANYSTSQVMRAAKIYADRMRLLGVDGCPECGQFGYHACPAQV